VSIRFKPLFVAVLICPSVLWGLCPGAASPDIAFADETETQIDENGYPVTNPSVPERHSIGGDLLGNIAADRRLSTKDLDLLTKICDYVVDKSKPVQRRRAAREIGYMGHKYGIPALLAVIRDDAESDSLKREAVRALGMIRDDRVVELLIDEALPNPEFDHQTMPSLVGLIGIPRELYDTSFRGSVRWPPEDIKKRAAYREVWRNWWKEVREKNELGRGSHLLPF
jgi:hypothetical protein